MAISVVVAHAYLFKYFAMVTTYIRPLLVQIVPLTNAYYIYFISFHFFEELRRELRDVQQDL